MVVDIGSKPSSQAFLREGEFRGKGAKSFLINEEFFLCLFSFAYILNGSLVVEDVSIFVFDSDGTFANEELCLVAFHPDGLEPDDSAAFLKEALERAKMGDRERLQALNRLKRLVPEND